MKPTRTNSASLVAFAVAAVISSSALAVTPPSFTDLDGDGVISEAEVKQIKDSFRATMLSEYDVNGDGKLSRLERREAKDARYAQMVQEFDTDGDGELSREERRSARQARKATLEAQFDVNQDGVLSDEERAGLESMKKYKGRGKKGDRKMGRKLRGDRNAEEVTGQATE